MWWRILVPTWRFFDSVGPQLELFMKVEGEWKAAATRPRFRWYSLFFNPQAGSYHALNNLLERLAAELAAGAEPEQLVSLDLVKDSVQGREFKITADGEEILYFEAAT